MIIVEIGLRGRSLILGLRYVESELSTHSFLLLNWVVEPVLNSHLDRFSLDGLTERDQALEQVKGLRRRLIGLSTRHWQWHRFYVSSLYPYEYASYLSFIRIRWLRSLGLIIRNHYCIVPIVSVFRVNEARETHIITTEHRDQLDRTRSLTDYVRLWYGIQVLTLIQAYFMRRLYYWTEKGKEKTGSFLSQAKDVQVKYESIPIRSIFLIRLIPSFVVEWRMHHRSIDPQAQELIYVLSYRPSLLCRLYRFRSQWRSILIELHQDKLI